MSFVRKSNNDWQLEGSHSRKKQLSAACIGLSGAINVRNRTTNSTHKYYFSSLKGHINPKLYFYDNFFSQGCVRSVKCIRLTTDKSLICCECRVLRKSKLLLATLRSKAKNKRQKFTNDNYCSNTTLCARLRQKRFTINRLRLSNHTLSKKVVSLSKTKETLSAVMAESTCRADQKSIYYNLRRAYDKGLLSSKRQVLSFITDISANIRRKTSGKRYSLAMKDFYSWLRIKGGPRIIKFMQDNLDGPGK